MISPGTMLAVVIVAAVLVGTKRIRSLGEDLGAALRSFRRGLHDENESVKDVKTRDPDSKNPTE